MRKIRKALEPDRPAFVAMYTEQVEDNEEAAKRFAEDLIYNLNTLVCTEEGRIIGTVSWQARGGLEDGIVELIGLGVHPDYQRQGVARQLVDSLLDDASEFYTAQGHGIRFVYLFMEAGNDDARSFYRSIGFKEVSEIPDMFPHDDGSIWTKLLE